MKRGKQHTHISKDARRNRAKRIAAAAIAIIIVFVMVIGMVSPFLAAETPVPPKSDIEITGTIGFSGRYKLMTAAPFVIHLQNNGDAFKGKVKIKINVSEEKGYNLYQVYSTPVELPTGSAKEVEMDIPVSVLKAYQTITLVDESGKEVASQKIFATGTNPENMLVGALTDNPDNLAYWKQLELNYFRENNLTLKLGNNLVFLDEKSFPDKSNVLKGFNMIVVDNYDTNRLSDAQKQALLGWLQSGGVLVLGAGENHSKVMKGISTDVVEVAFDGTTPVTDLSNVSDLYTFKTVDNKPFVLQNIKVTKGQNLTTKEGATFTATTENGLGTVVVHPFGLGVEPFASLSGRDHFLADVYRLPLGRSVSMGSYQNEWNNSEYLTGNLPSLSEKSIVVIFIVIGVYGIAVGPILYLFLKKKDIREKGFVVIPVISVLVTIAISIISVDTAYKNPIINTVSNVFLENKNGVGQFTSAVGVLSPKKGDVTVSFDQNVPISFNPNNYQYYRGNMNKKENSDLVELASGETPAVTFFTTSSWDTNTYKRSGTVDMQEGLDCTFTLEGSKLKGTLVNNTGKDFTEIIVGLNNSLSKYDNVASGDTIDIAQTVKLDTNYRDIYQAFNELYGDVYDTSRHFTAEQKRMIRFKQEMVNGMESGKYSSYGGGAMAYATSSSMSYTMPAFVPSQVSYQPLSVDIYAFSVDKLDNVSMKVNDKKASEYNTNLVSMHVPLDFATMKTFDLPFGLIQVSDIATTSTYDMYDNTMNLHKEADVAFTFTVPADNGMTYLAFQWENGKGTQEIFNNKTQQWEPLIREGYKTNVQDYINGDKGVVVRLVNAPPGELMMPQIHIKGGQ